MLETLFNLSLFPLVITIGAFMIGLWLKNKIKHPLCNPFVIAVILVGAFLVLSKMPMGTYIAGTEKMTWLITPATVALALPLYEQLKTLKKHLPAIIVGIVAGVAVSLGSILLLCHLFRLEDVVTISLLPRSITTAIGLVLSEQSGGISALTTFAIVVTGILGNLTGSGLCKLLKITDPIAQGVGFGTASHVIGTSRAMEIDPLVGAVSSLSLAVAGILTAVLFPIIVTLI